MAQNGYLSAPPAGSGDGRRPVRTPVKGVRNFFQSQGYRLANKTKVSVDELMSR